MSWTNNRGEAVDFPPASSEAAAAAQADREERAQLQQVEVIANIGYDAVRTLEDILGEQPSLSWDDLPDVRREEYIAGVKFILDRPHLPLSAQHDAWRARNVVRVGYDDPRMVPFDELPFGQQLKARLWRHITHAIIG